MGEVDPSILLARQKLAERYKSSKIGDKGSMRRKRQVHHSKNSLGDRNLEKLIKKISGIPNYETKLHEYDEVFLYKKNGEIETTDKPKAYINPGKNTFVTLKVEELKTKSQNDLMQKALEMLGK